MLIIFPLVSNLRTQNSIQNINEVPKDCWKRRPGEKKTHTVVIQTVIYAEVGPCHYRSSPFYLPSVPLGKPSRERNGSGGTDVSYLKRRFRSARDTSRPRMGACSGKTTCLDRRTPWQTPRRSWARWRARWARDKWWAQAGVKCSTTTDMR